jgi:phage shock protein E
MTLDNRILLALIAVTFVFYLIKLASRITAPQVAELLSHGAIVIDVRSPKEFDSGSLPGAQNLPLDEITNRIKSVAPDKDKPLLLHCLSGTRSGMARSRLKSLGYTNVHNLGSFSRAAYLLQPRDT